MFSIFSRSRKKVAPSKAGTLTLRESQSCHSSSATLEFKESKDPHSSSATLGFKENKGSLSFPTTPELKANQDPLQSPLSLKILTISQSSTVTPLSSARLNGTNLSQNYDDIIKIQKNVQKFIFAYLQTTEEYLEKTYPYCFKETKSANRSSSFNSFDEITNYLRWQEKANEKLKKKNFFSCIEISYPKEVSDYYAYLAKIDIDDTTATIRTNLIDIIPALDIRLSKALCVSDEIHYLPPQPFHAHQPLSISM